MPLPMRITPFVERQSLGKLVLGVSHTWEKIELSMGLSVYPPIVARLQLNKDVSVATKTF
jgi:hypothetical protein